MSEELLPMLEFELPSYDSVKFKRFPSGSVDLNFGRSNTSVEINIGQFGFTLIYDDGNRKIEKDGIWSEFPRMFDEFHAEIFKEEGE
jgi:hypothetical protein